MRTKKLVFFSFAAMTALGLSLSSCKKDNTSNQSDLMKQSVADDQAVQDAQGTMADDASN